MSSLTIQDLLDAPQFGCRLVAGAHGADRPVGWVHISTTPEIVHWIEAGDLVLTGGGNLPRDRAGQEELVRQLVERGACALALGSTHGPEDLSGLRDAADAAGFPFLTVDRAVPWGALGRAVAVANEQRVSSGLLQQIRVFDTLQARARGDITFAESLQVHSRITGYAFHLVDDRGATVLPELGPLPAGFPVERLRGDNVLIPEGYALPIVMDSERVATLVAVQERPVPASMAAVRHVATLAAWELADRERRREVARRAGGDALRQVRDNVLSPQRVLDLLARFDFPAGPVLVVRWQGDERQVTRVDRLLTTDGRPHLLDVVDGTVEVLLPAGAEDVCADLAAQLGVPVGYSAPCDDLSTLPLASRQAEWARQRAARHPEGGRARGYAEESRVVGWLPADETLLNVLVQGTLGPLIAYDERTGGDLLTTLRTYLGNDRSLAGTATQLGVHKHTVAYRLGRVAELTGRDLRATEALSETWLALTAYDIVRGALPPSR
ncbi:PucR family transcriptional regulator [Kineococcus sp. SYSU DK001]|uniref:PucR family transcriptional regulator n=1 Tax=Kineococcus sp. SYSU DK001 TaxID=3383122 RepID=UPI003D7D1C01